MPDIGPLLPGAPRPQFTSSASGSGIGALLREFHIPWPAADEGALREAAADWHRLAEAIRDNYGPANSAADSLTLNNAGAAITAFGNYWQKFGGRKGALPLAAEACDAMSAACTSYANDVAAVKRKIEVRALEIGAALVVGTIGAFITFGAAEAAADALAAGLAASAADWIADLGAADWIAQLGLDLSTTVGLISGTAADAVQGTMGALAGAVESGSYAPAVGAVAGTGFAGFAGGIASTALAGSLGGPVSPSQLAKDLLVSGLTAGTGGVLGKLGELSAPQLSSLLSSAAEGVSTADPQMASSLLELSRQVAGTTGKISASVLSSAASELTVSQHLDAEGFSGDQLQALLQAVAGSGEG